MSERGIEADPAKVKAIVNLCRHLVTSKSCVVCRAGSSLWSQKLELDVNPFPVKTRTLFGRQSTKKEVFIPQAWSDLSYVCSRLVASYYWWATPAFRVHHRRHFLILGRYGKRRWLLEGKIRPLTTSDLARKDYPPSAFGTEESQPLSTDPS